MSILNIRYRLIGFSCPSTAPVVNAGCRSAKLICSGLAPSALKMSVKMAPAAKRIFMPFRSAGLRTGRLLFESSRKPFSPQASGTTPCAAMILFSSAATWPLISASKALWSGIRKGSEKIDIGRICGLRLIVDETVKSIVPWRMASSSRVWSPPTSCEPG